VETTGHEEEGLLENAAKVAHLTAELANVELRLPTKVSRKSAACFLMIECTGCKPCSSGATVRGRRFADQRHRRHL
jgi:hypothetical protein